MTATLTRRATIHQLVAVYQEQCERVRNAFGEIADAERVLNAMFLTDRIHVAADHHSGRGGAWHDPDGILKRIRRAVWEAIIERLEIRRVMSASRWEECQKWLWGKELPEITIETVEEHVKAWVASLDEMHAEAVRETFEYLRPRNSRHKTNSQLEVPPKVVLTSVMDSRVWTMVSDYHGPRLAAVERVFKALDGKGTTNAGYYSGLENAIRDSAEAGRENGEPVDRDTPYFRVRVFKNGNAHIWFKRLDLLAKLNAIAGGKRLRPARVV